MYSFQIEMRMLGRPVQDLGRVESRHRCLLRRACVHRDLLHAGELDHCPRIHREARAARISPTGSRNRPMARMHSQHNSPGPDIARHFVVPEGVRRKTPDRRCKVEPVRTIERSPV